MYQTLLFRESESVFKRSYSSSLALNRLFANYVIKRASVLLKLQKLQNI